jgi:hypothetical protein
MSRPTNAEIIPDHTSDDLVMEPRYGGSSDDEGDHAPKNTVSDPRDGYLLDVAMLPHVLKVTVAVCNRNILAMWEVLRMITVAIMPNWNACCSIYNGEGAGESLHVTNGRVDILKLCIMFSHENIHTDLRALQFFIT